MPLLDHFHPPLHGPRHWEGFHQLWAGSITQQLNQDVLPPDYFAEPEITIGPEMEIDVATLQTTGNGGKCATITAPVWSVRPKISAKVSFSQLEGYEVRVYQDLGGAILRGAIELISPANKDRASHRRTFAAKCASHIRNGVGVVIVDIVTSRSANLHAEIFDAMDVKTKRAVWKAKTGLYAAAYRPVTVRKNPRVEVWLETLALGKALPVLPLWLALDLSVPVRLEESYLNTCQSLRISA